MSAEPSHGGNGIWVKGLSHSFGDAPVLKGISFTFPASSLVAVLGPSGCGKTTMLKAMSGLLRPQTGIVELGGMTPVEARRASKIGFAFQSPTLLPWRTALENVLLPLEIVDRIGNPAEQNYAKELLALVGLKDDSDKFPNQLSGGMQQRVGLARSLVTRPRFLFLDEPFGALDGLTRDRLNEQVRSIWQKLDLTIIFVTHSIEEAVFLADYVLLLSQRPASIVETTKIELPEDRDALTRSTDKFWQYEVELRKLTKGMG